MTFAGASRGDEEGAWVPAMGTITGLGGPRAVVWARMAVLTSAVMLMWPSAWGHSVTAVEFGHLPAGLAAWQDQALGIYRVCGPVSKLLYALPAHLAGVWVDYPAALAADARNRREWELGLLFQRQNPRQFLTIYRLSRLLPILVTVLGGCLVCEWSTRLFGAWPGVASLCVWSWMPLVLGHGPLVTSDVLAAVTLLLASRTFWAFLLRPSLATAATAGLTLGVALSTKFTLLILCPCWAALVVVAALRHCRPSARVLALGSLVLVVSLFVVNALYIFRGVGVPLSRCDGFQSSLFRGLDSLGDRRETAWLLEIPWPVPLEFLRGLDVQMADTERVQAGYLLGETRPGGWWYWYPVASLIKIPLPALAVFAVALIGLPNALRKGIDEVWAAFAILLPAAQAAVVVMATTGTGTNAAFRYMLPSLALLCVWTGRAWATGRACRRLTTCLLVWLAVNALSSYPDPISWSNELGCAYTRWSGSPPLIGDSLDWGQDLARLGVWVSQHPRDETTWVCVFGQGEGEPYGLQSPATLPSSEPWESATYLAVDVNVLYGYVTEQCITVGGKSAPLTPPLRDRLLSRTQYDHVGRTIRIYRVSDL